MGQAFIALSDDATGSETNPAGLTALVTPQLFVEGRLVSNRFRTLNPTATDINYDSSTDHVFSPTFLSLVYPFKNWAVAMYRQELARYSVTPHQPTVTLPGVNWILTPGEPIPMSISEFDSRIDIEAVNYGASVAYRWGERFNVGVSFRGTSLHLSTLETQPADQLGFAFRVPEGQATAVIQRTEGTDWDFSWVGGFIVKPADWLKLAGVYRSGSRHEMHVVFNENIYYRSSGEPLRSDIEGFPICIPDRYGIGMAVTPRERFTISLDLLRVEYGDMTFPFVDYIQQEFQDDYGYENGNEVHLGMEYTLFWGNVPISLRGGFYTDADNSLHFLGDLQHNDVLYVGPGSGIPIGEVYDNFPRAQDALFPKVGRDYHGTFGVGLSWKGHLQTDFAADLSRDTDYVVFSVLYNF
jgi:hypothetical protein